MWLIIASWLLMNFLHPYSWVLLPSSVSWPHAHCRTLTFPWFNTSLVRASLIPATAPAVMPAGTWTSVPLSVPPPAGKQSGDRAQPADLIVCSESDVMLCLSALVWENSRVSLSRVTGNRGTPFLHRQLALGGSCSGFGFFQLFDGVCSSFLCRWFPGLPFPMACFLILDFGPLFPVAHSTREMC